MSNQEKDFKAISHAIMQTYHDEMHKYLNSKAAGSLTDADVIVMIMNLTMGISTNIYYSLKQILPSTPMDFDFMRAKLSNSLVDSFEKIKQYNPKESVMPLTVEQLKEIHEKGEAIITMADGSQRTVTKDEILVKKEDAEKILQETKDAPHTPKIIIPTNRAVSR
jgi:hypothetical protein